MSPSARRCLLRALIVPLFVLGGCGGGNPEDSSDEPGAAAGSVLSETAVDTPRQIFDREFVFLSRSQDSTILLPWLFRTRVDPGGIRREISSRIVRAGSWEVLAEEVTDIPVLRNPERILPSEKVRLIAGDNQQFESVYFRDPPREVEIRFMEILAEWPRPGGEPIFLYRGQVLLPSGTAEGVVLDLARRWGLPDAPIGDWIFLEGAGGVQLFLEEALPLQGDRTDAPYRGWVRIEPSAGPWSDLAVRWEEMRPFEPARRDIPARWSLQSPSGDIEGELVATSSDLAVIEGEDPVRPAFGYFRVEGEVRILDREIEVYGVARHQQY